MPFSTTFYQKNISAVTDKGSCNSGGKSLRILSGMALSLSVKYKQVIPFLPAQDRMQLNHAPSSAKTALVLSAQAKPATWRSLLFCNVV